MNPQARAHSPETPGSETDNRSERTGPADAPKDAESLRDLDRSERLRDEIKGVTTEHAFPPRLEDEGQSGG